MPARKPNGLNRIVKKAKTISAWERVALGLIIITLLSKFQFQHISDIPNKFVLSVLFNLLFECNQKLDIYCSAHVTRFWNNHRQVFSCLGPVVYLLSKLLKLFGFPTFQPWASPHEGYSANLSTLSVPHEGYSANLSTLSVPHEGYSANLSNLSVPYEGYSVNLSTLNVPHEGYSGNALCALSLISTFLFIEKQWKCMQIVLMHYLLRHTN
jgi:hypothetical protein